MLRTALQAFALTKNGDHEWGVGKTAQTLYSGLAD
jgi:hypothetical protein